MTLTDEIFQLFEVRGAGAYFGERVSVTEHALQAAHFAQAAGAPPALVLAALLHDVGHLVVDVPDDLAEWTHDDRHEETGADWLALRFPVEVSGPVRLHVSAKRYLCATDPRYIGKLSAASVVTLKLQGGPMSPAEVARFESQPFHRDAVAVRRCDDQGKVPGLVPALIQDYRPLIEAMATR